MGWAQMAATPLTILLYHRVLPRTEGPYVVAEAEFQRQMRLLQTSGRPVVGLREMTRFLAGEPGPAGAVAVTFDDGCADLYHHAFPHLVAHGIPAVIFFSTGFAGRTVPFDGQPTAFLDWHQIREMHATGISFQSHTVNHADLTTLSDEVLRQELTASRHMLQERLGEAVDHVAYPYGRFDARVQAAAQAAGYTFAYAAGHADGPPWAVERMQVLGSDGGWAFRLKARGWASGLRRLKQGWARRMS